MENFKAGGGGRVVARSGTGAGCRRAAEFIRLHVGPSDLLNRCIVAEQFSLVAIQIKWSDLQL